MDTHVPNILETEQRLRFEDNVRRDVVVASGYAHFDKLVGHSDDEKFQHHIVEMVVGPLWRDVRDVSPLIVRAGLTHPNSDSDDEAGFSLSDVSWSTVNDSNGQRIKLRGQVSVKGENARVTRLAYQLTAAGTLVDLAAPGPSN